MMFDLGGILGGPVLGFLVNKFVPDNPTRGVLYTALTSAVAFVLLNFFAHVGIPYCAILLLIAGGTNCGADALLTGKTDGQTNKQNKQM